MTGEKFTIDVLQNDVANLSELIEAVRDVLAGMDYGAGEGRNRELDRVNGLVCVAVATIETLNSNIDRNYTTLKGCA